VPTIYHRVCFLMVGTLRFAHPTGCELICFARKHNLDVQLRQINTTGKTLLIFRNGVKPENQKYSA
jgi:hypothetical protein